MPTGRRPSSSSGLLPPYGQHTLDDDAQDNCIRIGVRDLVRRLDTGETTIVDLKSSERAQAEDVTDLQLHTYALGYREPTGRDADYVETYELDEGNKKPRSVDEEFMNDVVEKTFEAADSLRAGKFEARPERSRCRSCDQRPICSAAVS